MSEKSKELERAAKEKMISLKTMKDLKETMNSIVLRAMTVMTRRKADMKTQIYSQKKSNNKMELTKPHQRWALLAYLVNLC